MRIYTLQALGGDCFLIDFNNGRCVLIDGGYKDTYFQLKELLSTLKSENKYLEFVILTHYDADHIGGLLTLIEQNGNHNEEKIIHIENIITNSFSSLLGKEPYKKLSIRLSQNHNRTEEISSSQLNDFETLCKTNGYVINAYTNGKPLQNGDQLKGHGYTINIISPTSDQLIELAEHLKDTCHKWDSSDFSEFMQHEIFEQVESTKNTTENISSEYFQDIGEWQTYVDQGSPLNLVNKTSLAFEIEFYDKYLLFCGDGNFDDTIRLPRRKYNLIKLSHHGSYYGNQCFTGSSPIIADNYIISTNGIHSKREHPNRKLLSEIMTLKHSKKFYFNYDISKVKCKMYYLLTNPNQMKKYNFSCYFDCSHLDI